jgi:NADH dehydrogenase
MKARVVVTGANSAIGRVLVAEALGREGVEVVAAVRSARAAAAVPAIAPGRGRIAQIDYSSATTLEQALEAADALIHLPGLLIETRESPYEAANVATTAVAVQAARESGVRKLVLLSACGADPGAENRFWRTKGEAEQLVRESGLAWTIVRCPLVLGCGAAGDRALAREARSRLTPLLGGGAHREQPIAARDVARGLLAAGLDPERAAGRSLDLVGPECVSVRELARRAARLEGRRPRVLPIPVALARALAGLRRFGMTRDVIDVLTGHVPVDPRPAADALGIELTPLDRVIEQSLASAVRA